MLVVGLYSPIYRQKSYTGKSQILGVFRDTTKGLRIPSVNRLSLLLGVTFCNSSLARQGRRETTSHFRDRQNYAPPWQKSQTPDIPSIQQTYPRSASLQPTSCSAISRSRFALGRETSVHSIALPRFLGLAGAQESPSKSLMPQKLQRQRSRGVLRRRESIGYHRRNCQPQQCGCC